MRLRREGVNCMQNAVKPKSDQGFRAFRLDMDITCLLLDCILQHVIDGIDDIFVVHIFCLTETSQMFQVVELLLFVVVCRCRDRFFETEKVVNGIFDLLG